MKDRSILVKVLSLLIICTVIVLVTGIQVYALMWACKVFKIVITPLQGIILVCVINFFVSVAKGGTK